MRILWYNNYPFDEQLKRYLDTRGGKTMEVGNGRDGEGGESLPPLLVLSETRSMCLLAAAGLAPGAGGQSL